jgi:hypothetical protein
MTETLLVLALAAVLGALAAWIFTLWTLRWGATPEECAMAMPGDAFLSGEAHPSALMTRAVTIQAKSEAVWPWLVQLGRGAGWYSYDLLDNGGKRSARHIVSWIPPIREGDASPIGYVRHLVPGREITWWVGGTRFLGSTARLVVDLRLTAQGAATRLVIRMSADAVGGLPRVTLWAFRLIDGVMARRQLIGIRERAERHGAQTSDPDRPETGARDQYQHYEVIYADGGRAGTPGKERAERWRRAAVEAGVIEERA